MNSIPSIRQNSLIAAVAFLLVLLVGYLADVVLFRHPNWILVDDVILAVAAGLVVFRYERERSHFLEEKLRVIREMNAFVRNELQILYASLEHPDKTRVNTIERSVERIDWALRELLPGKEVAPKEKEQVKPVNEKIKRSA
jgi:hypothetical protein